MNQTITVLRVIAPIFAAVFLGMFARKKNAIDPKQMQGLQQFVMKFGLPCVLFNSCFSASLGAESLTSMVLLLPLMLTSSLWAFKLGKKKFPYHNLPMMFSSQESGMLGIPLFVTLFGVEHAYRIGVLDLAQSFIAIPVIAILAADAGVSPSAAEVFKKVIRSPLLIMSIIGLALNISGAAAWLNANGTGEIITETAAFIAQPVSASMLFSVGYNFSISKGNRKAIFGISAAHFVVFSAFCLIMQAILTLMPSVEPQTRWAILLFCILPASYLTPSLGRNDEEYTIASGVCSILTLVALAAFCIIAAVAV